MRVRYLRSILGPASAIVGIGVVLLNSSCFLPTGCDTSLGIAYHPVDTTIRVGESFHPVMTLTTCGGSKKLSPELRYSADDSSILQVDFAGKFTGSAVGQTTARISAQQYGITAPIAVTVR